MFPDLNLYARMHSIYAARQEERLEEISSKFLGMEYTEET
jgi:hypothetical protein